MPHKAREISLPLLCPDTTSLRSAASAILADIHRDTGESYEQIGKRLEVHKNTVASWANQLNDIGALNLAKLGAIYGKEYLRPYETLYESPAEQGTNPLPELALAVSTLANMDKGTPKQKLDALPVLKQAMAALDACIAEYERLRLS